MKKTIYANLILNALTGILFVGLIEWALLAGLEESIMAFALLFGTANMLVNGVFYGLAFDGPDGLRPLLEKSGVHPGLLLGLLSFAAGALVMYLLKPLCLFC